MAAVKRACVFCGSSSGADPSYAGAAAALGGLLAEHRITLVYGGAHVGLMGVLADAVLGSGGRAVGVIPRALSDMEVAHPGLTELHEVDSMHERKALMADLADAFIALPGGFGTLDELCEVLTWAQLGLHHKPVALLNVDGYYDALLAFLDRAVSDRFLRLAHRRLLIEGADPATILREFHRYKAPVASKWLDLRTDS